MVNSTWIGEQKLAVKRALNLPPQVSSPSKQCYGLFSPIDDNMTSCDFGHCQEAGLCTIMGWLALLPVGR